MMTDQSLPALTKAEIPPQTHIRRLDERLAQGKALREKTPRKQLAVWNPPAERADPVELLIQSSKGRMEELLPIRYGRMMVSPFTFYRGAAAIMAYDLAHTPSTGLTLFACGDCHLLNFGAFATAERKVAFDINDFDEVSLAPWEWDVKRLVASFIVAGRSNGFAPEDCHEAAWLAAHHYRLRLAEYATQPVLRVWNDSIDFDWVIANMADKEMKRLYTKKLEGATEQSAHEKEFAKLTFSAGDMPRIIDQPPLIYHVTEQEERAYWEIVRRALEEYKKTLIPARQLLLDRFKMVDFAFKVVGVGSVGTMCGIILLMSGNGDPLFLQYKQARQSVLEPYCGLSPFGHSGQRVVTGQRIMQASSDIFLGWTTGTGAGKRQFYLRQLSDAKIKPVIEIMSATNLKGYARLCGWILARAHARSGDPAVLTGYLGKSTIFEDAAVEFAEIYADQNEKDHAALLKAVRTGRIEARSE